MKNVIRRSALVGAAAAVAASGLVAAPQAYAGGPGTTYVRSNISIKHCNELLQAKVADLRHSGHKVGGVTPCYSTLPEAGQKYLGSYIVNGDF